MPEIRLESRPNCMIRPENHTGCEFTGKAMIRAACRLALIVALAAPLHAPALAAEPDVPAALISPTEAIRIAVQNRLSEKFTATSGAKKSEQGALVEYYSQPGQHLLWVDDNGLP